MNRKYTREHYLATVKKLKDKIPSVTLSTDMIVGFPGETDEDFAQTMELIKEVGYDSAFTFIYSIRKGTPAAEMDGQIDEALKSERFNVMLTEINRIIKEKNTKMIGDTVEVLVEKTSVKRKDRLMGGRTRGGHHTVNFPGDKALIGTLVNVKIIEARGHSFIGEKV